MTDWAREKARDVCYFQCLAMNGREQEHIEAALREAIALGERRMQERAARRARDSVVVECCNNPVATCDAIDERTGGCRSWREECCGNPKVTPQYPEEIAENILALVPGEEG